MARNTVRVELPDSSPDDFIKLFQDVLTEHDRLEAALKGSSPIKAERVTALRALLTAAVADRASGKEKLRHGAELLDKSTRALGLAEGQTTKTEGTVLFVGTQIRDGLLTEFKGRETALEPFGFKVVLGSAQPAKAKGTPKP